MRGGEDKMLEEKIRIELRFFFCRHDFCRRTMSLPKKKFVVVCRILISIYTKYLYMSTRIQGEI